MCVARFDGQLMWMLLLLLLLLRSISVVVVVVARIDASSSGGDPGCAQISPFHLIHREEINERRRRKTRQGGRRGIISGAQVVSGKREMRAKKDRVSVIHTHTSLDGERDASNEMEEEKRREKIRVSQWNSGSLGASPPPASSAAASQALLPLLFS